MLENNFDIVFINPKTSQEAEDLLSLFKTKIHSAGSIWAILYKKGKAPELFPTEIDILNAGRKLRLTGTKTAKISEDEYAFKFVIPVSNR